MKTSQLLPGDTIIRFTNFGGRSYTYQVTRVGFKSQFGHESFVSGVYQAKAYEFVCDGRTGVEEIKKGHILSPDLCKVIRNGKTINQ